MRQPGIVIVDYGVGNTRSVWSAVNALGYLRDDGALPPLLARFKREQNDEVRTMIVVAVGRIVQRADLARHHEIAHGLNYLAPGLGVRLVINLE